MITTRKQKRLRDFRGDATTTAIAGFFLFLIVYRLVAVILDAHLDNRALWGLGPLLFVLNAGVWYALRLKVILPALLDSGLDPKTTWRGRDGEVLYLFDQVDVWSSSIRDGEVVGQGKISTRTHDGWPSVTFEGYDYAQAVHASLLTLRRG